MEKICNILTTISDKKYFSMIILFIEKNWLNTYVHSLALTKKRKNNLNNFMTYSIISLTGAGAALAWPPAGFQARPVVWFFFTKS